MTYKLRAVPGFESNTPGIQLAAQTSDAATDDNKNIAVFINCFDFAH